MLFFSYLYSVTGLLISCVSAHVCYWLSTLTCFSQVFKTLRRVPLLGSQHNVEVSAAEGVVVLGCLRQTKCRELRCESIVSLPPFRQSSKRK